MTSDLVGNEIAVVVITCGTAAIFILNELVGISEVTPSTWTSLFRTSKDSSPEI
ncbi:unnamed protein product, partial [Rotaria magnacalcarata]